MVTSSIAMCVLMQVFALFQTSTAVRSSQNVSCAASDLCGEAVLDESMMLQLNAVGKIDDSKDGDGSNEESLRKLVQDQTLQHEPNKVHNGNHGVSHDEKSDVGSEMEELKSAFWRADKVRAEAEAKLAEQASKFLLDQESKELARLRDMHNSLESETRRQQLGLTEKLRHAEMEAQDKLLTKLKMLVAKADEDAALEPKLAEQASKFLLDQETKELARLRDMHNSLESETRRQQRGLTEKLRHAEMEAQDKLLTKLRALVAKADKDAALEPHIVEQAKMLDAKAVDIAEREEKANATTQQGLEELHMAAVKSQAASRKVFEAQQKIQKTLQQAHMAQQRANEETVESEEENAELSRALKEQKQILNEVRAAVQRATKHIEMIKTLAGSNANTGESSEDEFGHHAEINATRKHSEVSAPADLNVERSTVLKDVIQPLKDVIQREHVLTDENARLEEEVKYEGMELAKERPTEERQAATVAAVTKAAQAIVARGASALRIAIQRIQTLHNERDRFEKSRENVAAAMESAHDTAHRGLAALAEAEEKLKEARAEKQRAKHDSEHAHFEGQRAEKEIKAAYSAQKSLEMDFRSLTKQGEIAHAIWAAAQKKAHKVGRVEANLKNEEAEVNGERARVHAEELAITGEMKALDHREGDMKEHKMEAKAAAVVGSQALHEFQRIREIVDDIHSAQREAASEQKSAMEQAQAKSADAKEMVKEAEQVRNEADVEFQRAQAADRDAHQRQDEAEGMLAAAHSSKEHAEEIKIESQHMLDQAHHEFREAIAEKEAVEGTLAEANSIKDRLHHELVEAGHGKQKQQQHANVAAAKVSEAVNKADETLKVNTDEELAQRSEEISQRNNGGTDEDLAHKSQESSQRNGSIRKEIDRELGALRVLMLDLIKDAG